MFSKETIREIASVAENRGIETAALLAIAEVESTGATYALISGRREPLIRFEGHYFDARLTGDARQAARAAGLAHPKAGQISNPQTQAGRWRLLERASAVDRCAAYESTSWGLGQVMGAHWKALGFISVDELVRETRSGAAGQARLMADFILWAGLNRALRKHDWRRFARGYNGPAYRSNRYDLKMEAAWLRYVRMFGHPAAPPLLRHGSAGDAVMRLQSALNRFGAGLSVDGYFGRSTRRAVIKLQRRSGLHIDGVAGPETWRILADPEVDVGDNDASVQPASHPFGFKA